MSKRAFVMVREAPVYRRDAFIDGLARAGYKSQMGSTDKAEPGDVLVIWNRYGDYHQAALRFERRGGTVLVAENGYLGVDEDGIQRYALAIHGHNGSGWWPEGETQRFPGLGIEPKPWRPAGGHLYIRGQRGIGATSMASPAGWHHQVQQRISRMTSRKIVLVEHPGKPAVDPDQAAKIAGAVAGAHACIIWSSACGVRALVEGVPVFYDAPHWVCGSAARRGYGDLENPLMDDGARAAALERMAWAQWSVAELRSGEPFVRLAECQEAQRGPDPVPATA